MKILHFMHYARGGIVTVVLTQIHQSTNESIEYHIAVLEENNELEALAREQGIALHVLGTSPAAMWSAYRNLLRSLQPDVIHTHSYVPRVLTLAMISVGHVRSRHVSTLHNDYPYFHASDLRSGFKRFTEAVSLKSCERIVCNSQRVMSAARQKYGVPAERWSKIYNGIRIDSTSAPDPARRGSPAPVALAVGRVSHQKNYGLLIDCWRDVLAAVPAARLWIVGDGEKREELEQRCRNYGLERSVQFLGWRAAGEIPGLLAAADVFVLSSLHESLPTAMLEAYAAGLPVISTRVGGAEEVIEHERSGLLVDDAAGLTAALIRVLQMSPARRAALGEHGRRRILAEFSADQFVTQIEGIYLQPAR